MKKFSAIIFCSVLLYSCGMMFQGHGLNKPNYKGDFILELVISEPGVEVYVDNERYTRPEGMSEKQFASFTAQYEKQKAMGKSSDKLTKMVNKSDKSYFLFLKKKQKSRRITIKKDGFETVEFTIDRKFNPATLINVLNLGIYFVLVDLPFRGYVKYNVSSYSVVLKSKVKVEDPVVIKTTDPVVSTNVNNQKTNEIARPNNVVSKEDVSFLNEFKANAVTDGKARQTVKTMLSRQAVYHSISYSDGGDLLAFARKDQALEIREVGTAQCFAIDKTKAIDKVLFSDSGKYIAGLTLWNNAVVKNAPSDISVYDVAGKKWLWSFRQKVSTAENAGQINSCLFSPSGEKVAIVFEEKLFIMDSDSGYIITEFETKNFNKVKFPAKYYFVEELLDVRFIDEDVIEVSAGSIYTKYKVLKKLVGIYLPVGDTGPVVTNGVSRIRYNIKKRKKESVEMIPGFVLPSYVKNNTFMRGNYVFSYFANTNTLGISSGSKNPPVFLKFPGTLADIEIDSNQVIYYSLMYNSKVYRYDLKSNQELSPLEDHVAPVSDIEIAQEKNWIISSDVNGIKNFWSPKGDLLFRVYSNETGEYMVSTKDNYYHSSKGVLQDVRFMYQQEIYQYESFDLMYNRPDLVLKRIGNTNQELITSYENAVKMRNERSGIDPSSAKDMELPLVEITNQNQLGLSTSQAQIQLQVSVSSPNHFLKELIVYVNGTEDQRISLGTGKKKINQPVTVKLSNGTNYIEVSCVNANGNESFRKSHELICTKAIDSKVYFTGIGVSQYKQSDFNLRYADKDVRDLAASLKTKYGKSLVIDTLLNKNVTIENIRKSAQKLNKAGENDKIIVSLNGHGLLDQAFSFYFATYDIDFMNPAARGLAYSEIENLFASNQCRNRIILIDACHSGELDKTEIGESVASNKSAATNEVAFRGADQLKGLSKRNGTSTFQLMRDMFSDISYHSGTHIISAAGGFEYALESDKWKNGVFTFSVISGLIEGLADTNKDRSITVSELQNYVYDSVMSLTNGKQLPTSRRTNLRNDFIVGTY